MDHPFLIGDQLYLRSLELADAPTLLGWINDPETSHFLISRKPMNLEMERQFIEHVNKSDQDMAFMIVRRDNNAAIGVIGFHQIHAINRNAVFGIMIGDKACQGQGYGTQATSMLIRYGFETMNLHRITLQVFEYNERAIHIYEKLGFQKEGVLRQETYRRGRYWDTIMMGLLRPEWDRVQSTN